MRLIIEATWRVGKRVRLKRRSLLWWNERTAASPTWNSSVPKVAPCSPRFNRYCVGADCRVDESQLACHRCGSMLAHKDARSIVLRTVFGKVDVPSPRLSACNCAAKQGQPRRPVSPLCKAVHQRVTPELKYLRAMWAARLPYRQAAELLREVLPLDKGISFGSTRRRILAVGSALDAQIKRDIASGPKAASAEQVRESTTVDCVSVDAAWLSFGSSPKRRKAARDPAELKSPWTQKLTRDRHVNIVAGCATLADRTPRLYAYVHKLVPSAPARLDQFLFASGVAPDERVIVISDDAGEFGNAVDGSQLARGMILDWFHIAMKFKAAKNSVLGSQTIEVHERIAVETEIDHAKWLVWMDGRTRERTAWHRSELLFSTKNSRLRNSPC
jgi:hypothetical protein